MNKKPPEKWDCHSDVAPDRVLPGKALKDRMCGFWHTDANNPSMADEVERCSGCEYGPEAGK